MILSKLVQKIVLALMVSLGILGFAFAQTTPQVFVPSFWDPQNRLDKPDMSGLKSIHFLTEDDYPPFHFALPDGSLSGFNVDLARAICEELKVVCTIQPRRWDTLIDAINEKNGDALIASVAINDANRKKLEFTAPYYTTPGRFVAATTSKLAAISPASLAEKTIGVEAKSVHEAYLKLFFPKANARAYESAAALRNALKAGEIDALFGDGIGLALWLNGSDAAGCCAFKGGAYTESRYFGEGVGIGVRRDNKPLRRALDYALVRLNERGIYADLYLKWFPVGFY